MCDFPGGLFHPSDDKQDVAFRYAVEKINNNRDILPKSRLSAQIEQIKPQDSFHASKRGEPTFTFESTTFLSLVFCHLLLDRQSAFNFRPIIAVTYHSRPDSPCFRRYVV